MRCFIKVCVVVFAVGVSMYALADAESKSGPRMATAYFAGGCFWCMEPPFDKLDGVSETVSGYMGGAAATATYQQVSSGRTAHVEAIKITYDPSRVSYDTLLEVFWRNVDPFDAQGQFCDKGPQYKSYIYPSNAQEKQRALASFADVKGRFQKQGGANASAKIATEIVDAKAFYPAEAYHQNYYQRNPLRYKYYRSSCGRDRRLEAVWG